MPSLPAPQPHYWDHVYKKLGRHEWQTEYSHLETYEYCDAAERFGWLPRRLTGQTSPLRTDTWEATCGGEPLLPKEHQKTLILGSGNSTLGEEMHAAGWCVFGGTLGETSHLLVLT